MLQIQRSSSSIFFQSAVNSRLTPYPLIRLSSKIRASLLSTSSFKFFHTPLERWLTPTLPILFFALSDNEYRQWAPLAWAIFPWRRICSPSIRWGYCLTEKGVTHFDDDQILPVRLADLFDSVVVETLVDCFVNVLLMEKRLISLELWVSR
jgi:hypothetical protein